MLAWGVTLPSSAGQLTSTWSAATVPRDRGGRPHDREHVCTGGRANGRQRMLPGSERLHSPRHKVPKLLTSRPSEGTPQSSPRRAHGAARLHESPWAMLPPPPHLGPCANAWRHLGLSQQGEKRLLTIPGSRPGMLLNILQWVGQPHNTTDPAPNMGSPASE